MFVCVKLGELLLKLDLNLDIRFRGHFLRTFCLFLGSSQNLVRESCHQLLVSLESLLMLMLFDIYPLMILSLLMDSFESVLSETLHEISRYSLKIGSF